MRSFADIERNLLLPSEKPEETVCPKCINRHPRGDLAATAPGDYPKEQLRAPDRHDSGASQHWLHTVYVSFLQFYFVTGILV